MSRPNKANLTVTGQNVTSEIVAGRPRHADVTRGERLASLMPSFDPETYHGYAQKLMRALVDEGQWIPAKGIRQTVQMLMRGADGARRQVFAHTQETMARDFKMGKALAETIAVMKVCPAEFAEAVQYHETVVFGNGRTGYKQWWPGFVKNFEAIIQETRRGPGKTREELLAESGASKNDDDIRRQRSDWESAAASRASAETARKAVEEFRRGKQ